MKRFTIIFLALIGCSDDPKPSVHQDFRGAVDQFVDDATHTGGLTIDISNLSVIYKSFPDETTNDTQYSKDKIVVDKEFYNSMFMETAVGSKFILIYQHMAYLYANKSWDCYGGMRRITSKSEVFISSEYYGRIHNSFEDELFKGDKTVYNEMKADFEANNIPCSQ